VAFGISGFGAAQTSAAPQIFQALSLGGSPPQAPVQPYGTPNPNLVPVARTGNPALPGNLTLAAHPVFQAILHVSGGSSVLAYGHPPLGGTPNTTVGVGATNPSVALQLQGQAPAGLPTIGNPPAGPVSFSLTVAPASIASGVNALEQTVAGLQSALSAAQQPPTQAAGASQASNAAQVQSPGPVGSGGQTANGSAGTTPAPAAAGIVAKIVSTVQTLAVAAVYPAPIFSFSA